ncbi:MAG: Chemotaxis protein methyltransferase CheR [Myxococcales bacterium]|nr:Chemotaxis protein methyltransferase CheR [Myxococcales bacterium]
MMAAPSLTPQLFSIFKMLIEERCGLHYHQDDVELLADRIGTRAAERGFESLLDYYYFLRYDADGLMELDRLIELLLVHETYFFREVDQLRVLVDVLLAPAVAAGQRPRVWCAACATGEEPLTIAMLLDERAILDRVGIVASDLSTAALERARRGEFGTRALRATPPEMFGRYLEQRDNRAVVRPGLIEQITWQRLNLVDAPAVAAMGTFDAILCRNVLIYFTDQTACNVVESLAGCLRPGGSLVVGVSESLMRFGTSLNCEERGGSFFYQKAS